MSRTEETVVKLRRHGKSAKTAKAYKLANSPEFKEFFSDLREQYLRDMDQIELDGSQDQDRVALEIMRRYQTLMDLKRTVFGPIAADKKSTNPEN